MDAFKLMLVSMAGWMNLQEETTDGRTSGEVPAVISLGPKIISPIRQIRGALLS